MKSLSVIAVLACTGAAMAQISSITGGLLEARRYNDFATTNLSVNGTNYPAPVSGVAISTAGGVAIRESNFPTLFEQANGFANRHEVSFTANGSTKYTFLNNESFEISFDINLSGNNPGRRKESGLFIRNPRPFGAPTYGDEGAVLVGSDGEVAVFGAAQPFSGLGNSVYTAGTTANFRYIYTAPGTLNAKATYRLIFTDAVTGLHDTGHKLWGTEADGTNGFNDGTEIHMFIQSQRDASINDAGNVIYSNISIIPAPGAAAVLGLGALVGLRRRR